MLKKNPSDRLSLEGVMKHNWITKFAKIDHNTINVSLNTFASNMAAAQANSSTSQENNAQKQHQHQHSDDTNSTYVISNNSNAVNQTSNYLIKSAPNSSSSAQTKPINNNVQNTNLKSIYGNNIYSSNNMKN